MATTKSALFLIITVASASLFGMAQGASYTVGAPAGSWDLKTNYTQWASPPRRFFPGDSLRFRYPAAEHNVLEVTKAAYDSCSSNISFVPGSGGSSNSSGAVIATYQTGNDVIQLVGSSGVPTTRYFVCGVAGHCAAGMRLKVSVAAQPPAQCRGRGIRRRCTRPPPAAAPAASSAVGVGRSGLWTLAAVAVGSLLLCS